MQLNDAVVSRSGVANQNCSRSGIRVYRELTDEQVDSGALCGHLLRRGGFSYWEELHVNGLREIGLQCLPDDVRGAICIDAVSGSNLDALVSVKRAVKHIARDV